MELRMNYFCNCKPDKPKQFTNRFRVVKADKDGICLNCGHYTLSSDKKMHYVAVHREKHEYDSSWLDDSYGIKLLQYSK